MNKNVSKKNNSKNSLKTRLNKYILTKGDICCDEDIEKKKIINMIIDSYKKNDIRYLDSINNDLLLFIGYKIDLYKDKNTIGIKLWDEIDNSMLDKKKNVSEKKLIKLLTLYPNYYLLSFLGFSVYKFN